MYIHEVLVQSAICEGPAIHHSIGGNTEISHILGGLNTEDMPIYSLMHQGSLFSLPKAIALCLCNGPLHIA